MCENKPPENPEPESINWELAWMELTTAGGPLHNPEFGFIIAESMATAVLFDPAQAKALAGQLQAGGQDIRKVIIFAASDAHGDEAAAHFPDMGIERFYQGAPGVMSNLREESADQNGDPGGEALSSALALAAQASIEGFLTRPGGLRDQVRTAREEQPDVTYGWTEDALPGDLERRTRGRR